MENGGKRKRGMGWWRKLLMMPVLILMLLFFLVIFPLFVLWHIGLLLSIWAFWCPRGRNVIFIYSESTNWQRYIEENYLSRFDERVVVLNWSKRAEWKTSLATLAFRRWGGNRSFNPLGLVFKPFHRTRVFRFYESFLDQKHGRSEKLKKLEAEFFEKIV